MTDTPAHYSKAQRRLLTAVGGLGVAALAGATFVLSYDDLRTLAIRGGAAHHRAFLYPGIVDGLVVVVVLSILAARRASWWSRAVRWLLLLVLVAGAGAAGVERALNHYRALPHHWVSVGVAAAPWVVLLIAVWLWTSMIKQALRRRRGRSTAPADGDRSGAPWEPEDGAAPTVMDGDIVPGFAREETFPDTRPLRRPAAFPELGPGRPAEGTEVTATRGRASRRARRSRREDDASLPGGGAAGRPALAGEPETPADPDQVSAPYGRTGPDHEPVASGGRAEHDRPALGRDTGGYDPATGPRPAAHNGVPADTGTGEEPLHARDAGTYDPATGPHPAAHNGVAAGAGVDAERDPARHAGGYDDPATDPYATAHDRVPADTDTDEEPQHARDAGTYDDPATDPRPAAHNGVAADADVDEEPEHGGDAGGYDEPAPGPRVAAHNGVPTDADAGMDRGPVPAPDGRPYDAADEIGDEAGDDGEPAVLAGDGPYGATDEGDRDGEAHGSGADPYGDVEDLPEPLEAAPAHGVGRTAPRPLWNDSRRPLLAEGPGSPWRPAADALPEEPGVTTPADDDPASAPAPARGDAAPSAQEPADEDVADHAPTPHEPTSHDPAGHDPAGHAFASPASATDDPGERAPASPASAPAGRGESDSAPRESAPGGPAGAEPAAQAPAGAGLGDRPAAAAGTPGGRAGREAGPGEGADRDAEPGGGIGRDAEPGVRADRDAEPGAGDDLETTAPRMIARAFLPTDVRLVGPPAPGTRLGDTQPDGIRLRDTDPDGIPLLTAARPPAAGSAEGGAGVAAAGTEADTDDDWLFEADADDAEADRPHAPDRPATGGVAPGGDPAGESGGDPAGESGADPAAGGGGTAPGDAAAEPDSGTGGPGPVPAPPPPSGTFRSSPTPPRRRG